VRILRELTSVHLDRAGAMNEEFVRFYIAEIALAIDYLHSKRIVHR
jgi:serine/threonine kinase 32